MEKTNKLILKTFLHEHIKYEIDMLIYSYIKLQEFGKTNEQMNINVFLEIFLIHSRNLYEFLYRKAKSRPNDSRAYDFFNQETEWVNIMPKTSIKQQIDDRAGKELAHITYKRINGVKEEKKRNISTIFQDLKETIKLFLTKIPEKYDGKILLKNTPFLS